ncbi:MAG: PAS domain S-box protein [Bacteroidales bacterium]|nr:PAS domain S-box protein [Bacteroidales bacterium]
MDAKSRKETISQYTILAVVVLFVFPLASVFIDLIINDVSYNAKGLWSLLKSNPVHWIVIGSFVIVSIGIHILIRYFTRIVIEKQNIINVEQARTKTISRFAQQLIHDDFQASLPLMGEDDDLGKSLINLRDTLKSNKEEEAKRRKEDELRNWLAEGMAHFGEILRNNIQDQEQLAFNTIKALTKYLGAIQGGFYMLDDTDENNRFFDLKAFFAYDRKKFTDQKVQWGDGLIGTAAKEQKTVYITQVPESYINVTSGLGQSNPKCLLIVPIQRENEIHGVIELASLNPMEAHQVTLVEKVAESVASTLSAVKTNIQTARLLEDSKAQALALSSQEEEMRQNLEELQATQEEATRQAERFMMLENTVNHTMIRAEYNVDGTLLYANTKFLDKLEYTSNTQVEGKKIHQFISEKDKEWFDKIWEDLAKGGRHFEGYMKHITQSGKDLWTVATYTCIRKEDNTVDKILFLALDTTEQKKLSLEMEGVIDSVNRSGIKLELDINGNIIDSNEYFANSYKYNLKDIRNLSIFDLIDPIEIEGFNKKWETIIKGVGFMGQFKTKAKDNTEKWLRGAFSAVFNMYNEVDKIIYIGQDVTNEKQMEIELRNQTDILKKQEKLLRESEKELSRKLREARSEMQQQYKETEHIKIRNERTLEGVLDAIITTGHDNKIIFFNRAAEELWGYQRQEVVNHDIGILFSHKMIEEDEFLALYTGPGDNKIIGVRKEIKIYTKQRKEKPVLILLSRAQVENEITYTAFIQNVEVELF